MSSESGEIVEWSEDTSQSGEFVELSASERSTISLNYTEVSTGSPAAPPAMEDSFELAMNRGDVAMLGALLDAQGYPRHEWSDYSLLNKAMRRNQLGIAEYLIDRRDCRVNRKRTYSANTPLHYATRGCNRKLVMKLLERGARIQDLNSRSQTPLHAAFRYFDAEVIDALLRLHLEKSHENLVDDDGLTYLHIACCRDGVATVCKLLEENGGIINCRISANDKDYGGYTPLHMAVACNQLEVAELLIRRDADIYAQDINGCTPLHLALLQKNRKMIALILTYDKAKCNIVNKSGVTHFHAACVNGDEDVVMSFLRVSSHAIYYINQTTYPTGPGSSIYPGYTSLHFAAEFGQTRVCSQLLSYSANCGAVTFNGCLPSDIARMNHHYEAAQVIENYCSSFEKYYNSYMSESFNEQRQSVEMHHRQDVLSYHPDLAMSTGCHQDTDTFSAITGSTFDDGTLSYQDLHMAFSSKGRTSSPINCTI